ncbi:TonB-dependent receptor [uncultured Albimonas sp.]|uniref:TonB-dependent receptor plug domain-containing protein n=1 Tax=uncultured Albimonas sp. TaxID=1331701 RepID=UPI0030EF343D|tara:strand:+ start:1396 stop:3351 length:1956 start_codon:yes stop_codon:yes gene_type:complete
MSRTHPAPARALLAASSLALCPHALHAQEPVALEPIVVSGGLTPIAAEKYGRAYSVVTAQDLEDRQTTYAVDALRALPGVEVSRTGGFGGLTQVRLRGAEGNHTLVLIDGVEVSAPEQGEFDFGGLLAADIERIEVLRGPQSALYGANALGGVISITTRRAREPGLRWSGEGEVGTDGTGAVQAAVRGLGETGSFSLSLARRETEGFDVSGTPGGEADGDRNLTFNGRGEIFAADWLTLGATLRVTDRHSDLDGSLFAAPTEAALVYDDASAHDRTEALGSLYAIAELGRLRSELRAAYLHADDSNTLNGVKTTDTSSTRLQLSAQATVGLDAASLAAADHSLTGKVEYERESFVANDPALVFDPSQLDEQTRGLYGLAAEYRGTFLEALDLQLGLRHDINDAFEDATTWSAGASYRIAATGTRLHASAGTAVQNPTMFEQFGFTPGQWQGNPNLEPEESFGWDVGVEQRLWDDRLVVDVTWFNQDLKNEIGTVYLAPAFTVGTPVNQPGTSERQGIEVASTLYATDWMTLGLSYTWLDAEESTGLVEVRRPEHELGGYVTFSFLDDRARVTLDGRYVAGNRDLDYRAPYAPGARVALDDYVVVNVAASWAMTEQAEIYGRVTNALDADYEEVHGFATQGIAAYAGLRVRF